RNKKESSVSLDGQSKTNEHEDEGKLVDKTLDKNYVTEDNRYLFDRRHLLDTESKN
ncbi:MAG: hypothetical protein MHPSP_003533, partial [Paramarteilia canceri]